jgi:hypothetical protein
VFLEIAEEEEEEEKLWMLSQNSSLPMLLFNGLGLWF